MPRCSQGDIFTAFDQMDQGLAIVFGRIGFNQMNIHFSRRYKQILGTADPFKRFGNTPVEVDCGRWLWFVRPTNNPGMSDEELQRSLRHCLTWASGQAVRTVVTNGISETDHSLDSFANRDSDDTRAKLLIQYAKAAEEEFSLAIELISLNDVFVRNCVCLIAQPRSEDSMCDQRIVDAIDRARPGIDKYLKIMSLLHGVDVSHNTEFQTLYKGFYRVRQRTPEWYSEYFSLLESCKGGRPGFAYVLNELRTRICNEPYEPSFASKLVASADPWSPIWDVHVLRNMGKNAPRYTSRTKHSDAVTAYSSIVAWYDQFMTSAKAKRWIALFNENVGEYYKITDIKKVDFVLWQLRD